jgi:hypothetical protein
LARKAANASIAEAGAGAVSFSAFTAFNFFGQSASVAVIALAWARFGDMPVFLVCGAGLVALGLAMSVLIQRRGQALT